MVLTNKGRYEFEKNAFLWLPNAGFKQQEFARSMCSTVIVQTQIKITCNMISY